MVKHIINNLRRILLAGCCGVAFSLYGSLAAAGSIVGSAHDFSGDNWSGGEICVACHTPHNSDTTVTDAPLWNHQVTQTSFTLYTSPTLDATNVGQPAGSSKLCLSCHDGTVAVDNFGGNTAGTVTIGAGRNLGTSLLNDHPISFTYDTALANTDGALFNPSDTTNQITIGDATDNKTGTIDEVLLLGGQVQCASCHDVHNKFTGGVSLLRISNAGSGLCLTCHNK